MLISGYITHQQNQQIGQAPLFLKASISVCGDIALAGGTLQNICSSVLKPGYLPLISRFKTFEHDTGAATCSHYIRWEKQDRRTFAYVCPVQWMFPGTNRVNETNDCAAKQFYLRDNVFDLCCICRRDILRFFVFSETAHILSNFYTSPPQYRAIMRTGYYSLLAGY
jgi:hypothetical protein